MSKRYDLEFKKEVVREYNAISPEKYRALNKKLMEL